MAPRTALLATLAAATLLLAGAEIACVKRPPPIKSQPTLAEPAPEGGCTRIDGIDPTGHPACSDGCLWSPALRSCAPEPPSSASASPRPPAAPSSAPAPAPSPAATSLPDAI